MANTPKSSEDAASKDREASKENPLKFLTQDQYSLLHKALQNNAPEDFGVTADSFEENENAFSTVLRLAATIQDKEDRLCILNWPEQYAEQQEYLNRYNQEYNWNVPPAPDFNICMQSLSPEKIDAIKHLHRPTLLIIPPVGFTAFTERLHPSNEFGSNLAGTCFVDDHYTQHPHPPASDWSICIIEGAASMPIPSKELRNTGFEARCTQGQKHRKDLSKYLTGTDRLSYASLMLLSLHQDNPIDDGAWTILDADKGVTTECIVAAQFIDRSVVFGRCRAGDQSDYACMRCAVWADIKPNDAEE